MSIMIRDTEDRAAAKRAATLLAQLECASASSLARVLSSKGLEVRLTRGRQRWTCVLTGLPLGLGEKARASSRSMLGAIAEALALVETHVGALTFLF